MGRLPHTRVHRGEITAKDDDVFVVFTKDPCESRVAAPHATVVAADELRREGGRASVFRSHRRFGPQIAA